MKPKTQLMIIVGLLAVSVGALDMTALLLIPTHHCPTKTVHLTAEQAGAEFGYRATDVEVEVITPETK